MSDENYRLCGSLCLVVVVVNPGEGYDLQNMSGQWVLKSCMVLLDGVGRNEDYNAALIN